MSPVQMQKKVDSDGNRSNPVDDAIDAVEGLRQ